MKARIRSAAPAPSSPAGFARSLGSPHALAKPASHQAAIALQRFMSHYIRKNNKIRSI
jgi:hypothetical protein